MENFTKEEMDFVFFVVSVSFYVLAASFLVVGMIYQKRYEKVRMQRDKKLQEQDEKLFKKLVESRKREADEKIKLYHEHLKRIEKMFSPDKVVRSYMKQ